MKITKPNNKICAMCIHWNGPLGGKSVKPRIGMMNVFEFDPQEKNICYKNHFNKAAWHSCNQWQNKF
ncbi:hypothetical protein DEAC_c43130 [Desulfosporosinus acididurans]|uniref:Uncharacterized protein n=1 Tax=Desulfosporosinus acididurans TaxID=476652 RepID=A0A0J1FJY6_9FIRM|nr:hypothetical protein DEAC_c43130 [Desulfosporosinus acididurans]